MNIRYQELSMAIEKIKNKYNKNPRKSVSATFRFLRKQNSFYFFGDYPILAIILHTIISLGITPSRYQTIYALNQSEELQCLSKGEKNILLNQLINPMSVQMKSTNKLPREEIV